MGVGRITQGGESPEDPSPLEGPETNQILINGASAPNTATVLPGLWPVWVLTASRGGNINIDAHSIGSIHLRTTLRRRVRGMSQTLRCHDSDAPNVHRTE